MYFYNVVFDLGITQAFTYNSEVEVNLGNRVLVEFHNKEAVGFVWQEVLADSINYDINKIKPILLRFDQQLVPSIIDLVEFASQYYHYQLGQTLFTAIPSLLRKNQPITIEPSQSYQLAKPLELRAVKKLTPKIAQLYQLFVTNQVIDHDMVKQMVGVTCSRLLNKWLADGIITIVNRANSLPIKQTKTNSTLNLNSEQMVVVEEIVNQLHQHVVAILYGITGSGKTEVYLSIISAVLDKNLQVLVLVPEINLTPQLLSRFNKRFPSVALHVLTSDVTPQDRLAGYIEAQTGTKQIIIGTRLSVFTPFKNLGLIVVDEEHDLSFKQNDGLRYNARDLAVYRAKYHNIPIILGSATPSLETLYNYKLKKYILYKLTQRGVGGAVLPKIRLVDIRNQALEDGLSPEVVEAIAKRLANQELILVYINRRGYAPVVSCYDCGYVCKCKNCSMNLVLHTGLNRLKCHHCGFSVMVPSTCFKCGSNHIEALGRGTQKIEEKIGQLFPNAKIMRIDQDTTSKKAAWDALYRKIDNNQVDILVGTQMLTKGHDFHNLTLVVGIDLDNGLYSYDFRAMEYLFVQLMQVSGRAGRGLKAGEVLLQTRYPEHDLYTFLQQHDFSGFANYLLKQRKQFLLPPYVHYALFRASSSKLDYTMLFLNKVHKLLVAKPSNLVVVFNPVASVIKRLKNKERGQLLISANNRQQLHQFIEWALPQIEKIKHKKDLAWHIDIDPIEM
jgi:primosomal protein N' (replication factor Y)